MTEQMKEKTKDEDGNVVQVAKTCNYAEFKLSSKPHSTGKLINEIYQPVQQNLTTG
jgi:hypothetical protein